MRGSGLRPETEADFLDIDGSARDMNFESPSWIGVASMLAMLRSEYPELDGSCCTHESIVEALDAGASCLDLLEEKDNDFLYLVANRTDAVVRHLQVFIVADENAQPFVELTTFPDQIDVERFSIVDFIEWIDRLRNALEASRYFIRYENASWSFGDSGPGTGVIASG